MELDLEAIRRVLPHRYPFLLIDRIVELVPGEAAVGIKNVSANEPFFEGHFPGRPVMPGVLIIEAMAQTASVLMGDQTESGAVPLFLGVDKARFRRQVVPGDQLRLEVKLLRKRRNVCRVAGRAYVDETLAAEAEMMATIAVPEGV